MFKPSTVVTVLLLLIVAFFCTQCTEKYPAQTTGADIALTGDGCVDCHINAAQLKLVATPLPVTDGDAGEG